MYSLSKKSELCDDFLQDTEVVPHHKFVMMGAFVCEERRRNEEVEKCMVYFE